MTTKKEKIAICKSCPEKTDKNVCSKCGCFIPLKILIPITTCPLGKWPE